MSIDTRTQRKTIRKCVDCGRLFRGISTQKRCDGCNEKNTKAKQIAYDHGKPKGWDYSYYDDPYTNRYEDKII